MSTKFCNVGEIGNDSLQWQVCTENSHTAWQQNLETKPPAQKNSVVGIEQFVLWHM